jgi:hypothetical protein
MSFHVPSPRLKSFILSLFAFLTFFPVSAQIPTGGWRDHLPYYQCIKVVEIGSKIYCATNNNIFTYNSGDKSLEKLSRINGLSDMGISTMEYYQSKNILLIAYTDGNIDLLINNVITNIPALKNKLISGYKTANHICFNGNYAYISYPGPLGILVIDLVKKEIKDNYQIGSLGESYTVNSVAVSDSIIYAATNNGIFSASVNNPFLVDYTQWQLVTNIPNANGQFDKICYYNGMIIANSVGTNNNSDHLYFLKNNVWASFLPGATMHKHEIRQWGNWLLITGYYEVYQLGQNLNVVNQFSYSNPYSTLIDNNGNAWFADNNDGLLELSAGSQNYSVYCPNGPEQSSAGDVWRMQYFNGSIYVTGGGADQAWTPIWKRGELFQFTNQTWSSIINGTAWDFSSIAVDPVNPAKVYVGSWNSGVLVYNNGQLITNYTNTNSPLKDLIGGPNEPYIFVGGTAFDAANNLWVTNTLSSTALLALEPGNGTWISSFPINKFTSTTYLSDVLTIDQGQNHQVWVVAPREDTGLGSGLFAFSYSGTVDNETNVNFASLIRTLDIYGHPITSIFCAALDNNKQDVWAGTSTGILVYYNVFNNNVFNGNLNGTQPAVPQKGTNIVYPLLGGIQVNCIAVDGDNQKWIGTQGGGAFLVSADGTKQIYNFNVSNSPIFSNNVKAIAIEGTTGEVFFGTDQGIISYRAVATAGDEDFSHVYVYPDPVRDSYRGNIIITGLMTNTIVKITDISGNLVFQTVSDGGQAEWDGNIVNSGRRVATGVYLVFLTTEDGSKSFVTKMLVIH